MLSFILLLAFAQTAKGQQFGFWSFSLDQGLAQQHVTCIEKDVRGQLWLGTRGGGMALFDGAQFKNYQTEDGLLSNIVLSIEQGTDGHIWVSSQEGLQKYDGLEFETVDFQIDIANITQLKEINDSTLLIGTKKGLLKLNTTTGELSEFNEGQILRYAEIRQISKSHSKTWIATTQGVFSLNQIDKIVQYGTDHGLPSNQVINVVPQGGESLLIFFEDAAPVYFFPEKGKVSNIEANDFPGMMIHGLFTQDRFWVVAASGLFFLEEGSASWVKVENLPVDPDEISSLYADGKENLWFGTQNDGLLKLFQPRIGTLKAGEDFPAGTLTSVCQDKDGVLWVGMESGKLLQYKDSLFSDYTNHSGYLDQPISDLEVDHKNRLWVATAGKGIALLDSLGLFKIFTDNQGLPSSDIYELHFQAPDKMWVSSESHPLAYINIEEIDSNEYFGVHQIRFAAAVDSRKFFSAPNNDTWISRGNGQLLQFNKQGNLIRFFGEEEGLRGTEILDLSFESYPSILISLAGRGILSANMGEENPLFTRIPENSQLRSRNITSISKDARGNLWLGHERGIDQLSPEGKVSFISLGLVGDPGAIIGKHPTTNEDQSFWLLGQKGIAFVEPSGLKGAQTIPELSITGINLFYEPILGTDAGFQLNPLFESKEGLELNWKENHLGFSFSGVDFDFPDQVRYQWRLQPLEKEWSPISYQTLANYPNLAPGAYQYQVRATTNSKDFSETKTFSFKINAPVWQKAWFKIIAALTIGLIGFLLIRSFIRSRTRSSENRAEKLSLENNLLELRQKALQLQMNPHYIFNTLNSINSLIATGKSQEARSQINTFAKQLRSTLSNSREEKISLENEIESLGQYLKMLQFSHSEDFKYDFQVETGINSEEIELPPMLLQPFVENAVLHGFQGLDRLGELSVQFSKQGQLLKCVILDNGIGRKASAEKKKSGHRSHAINVTLERLDSYKNGLNYNSLEIVDLYEDGTPSGTQVTILLPYWVNF
ncbi:MAG: histidine kinase [Saprospiraceae bacterium]|nr:histidine kinase [Saprospiraceae bacterium]